MNYEYTMKYIRVKKQGWRELAELLSDLPADGWELFMAIPITQSSLIWFGNAGGKTTAIVHYFRRPIAGVGHSADST
jgi:hypothetical protein